MFDPPYAASTWIPYLQLLVEAIRSLAWPIAIISVVLLFKEQLRPLLAKIRRLSPSGVDFHEPTQNDSSGFEKDSEMKSTLPQDIQKDSVAQEIYGNVVRSFEEVPESERIQRLFVSLTYRILEKDFLRAYLNIFGSQIEVLEFLNANPATREKLKADFEELKKSYEAFSSWDLDDYLQYLKNWQFITEDNGRFKITSTGNLFLTFLAAQQLDKNKAL